MSTEHLLHTVVAALADGGQKYESIIYSCCCSHTYVSVLYILLCTTQSFCNISLSHAGGAVNRVVCVQLSVVTITFGPQLCHGSTNECMCMCTVAKVPKACF